MALENLSNFSRTYAPRSILGALLVSLAAASGCGQGAATDPSPTPAESSGEQVGSTGQAATSYWNWATVSGQLRRISVGSSSRVVGVNAGGGIFRRDNESWTGVSGSLSSVSVGSDGTLYGTNSQSGIFRLDPGGWTAISGSASQVAVGSAGEVWVLNSDDYIYRRVGSSWTNIPGRLRNISVGADGTVWGVNAQNAIFRSTDNAGNWVAVSGSLQVISVGNASTVWGVNSANDTYHWLGGNNWELIPSPKFQWISVASDGALWGIGLDDSIWRSSVTPGTTAQAAAFTPATVGTAAKCPAGTLGHGYQSGGAFCCVPRQTKELCLVASNGRFVRAESNLTISAAGTSCGLSETFSLEGSSSTGYSLQSLATGMYITALDTGGVAGDHSTAGAWERFQSGPLGEGAKVSLKGVHGKYLVAEGGGGGVVNANRTEAGPWETFTAIESRQFCLMTYNGRFLRAESNLTISAAGTSCGLSETFSLEGSSSTGYTFRSAATGMYITALNTGGVVGDHTTAGAWERFQSEPLVEGAKVSFRGAHSKYLVAEGGGGGAVNANRTAAGAWETFSLIHKTDACVRSP